MRKRLIALLTAWAALSLSAKAQWEGGIYEGDFPDLIRFVSEEIARHPTADPDSLQRIYLETNFGDAANSIDWYLRLSRKAMEIGGTKRLLSTQMRLRYNECFNQAEAAVAGDKDSAFFRNVCIARLPLQYVELELAKEGGMPAFSTREKLDLFEARCQQFNIYKIPDLENNTIEYCKLYRRCYVDVGAGHLSSGKTVRFLTPPEARFADQASTALTDGRFGDYDPQKCWIGWKESDGDLVIDLGKVCEIRSAATEFLLCPDKAILAPLRVSYALSQDGKSYQNWATIDIPLDSAKPSDTANSDAVHSPSASFLPVSVTTRTPLRARYVRVHITATIECPDWHKTPGAPSYFFIDEITLD